jgi:hypothetical protein
LVSPEVLVTKEGISRFPMGLGTAVEESRGMSYVHKFPQVSWDRPARRNQRRPASASVEFLEVEEKSSQRHSLMSHLMELAAKCYQSQRHRHLRTQQLKPSLSRPHVSLTETCSHGCQPDARDKSTTATLCHRLPKTQRIGQRPGSFLILGGQASYLSIKPTLEESEKEDSPVR